MFGIDIQKFFIFFIVVGVVSLILGLVLFVSGMNKPNKILYYLFGFIFFSIGGLILAYLAYARYQVSLALDSISLVSDLDSDDDSE